MLTVTDIVPFLFFSPSYFLANTYCKTYTAVLPSCIARILIVSTWSIAVYTLLYIEGYLKLSSYFLIWSLNLLLISKYCCKYVYNTITETLNYFKPLGFSKMKGMMVGYANLCVQTVNVPTYEGVTNMTIRKEMTPLSIVISVSSTYLCYVAHFAYC